MSGKWNGWGVSVAGPLHLKNLIPNQDSFIFKKYSWGVVAGICDGLGSRQYSHIGSKELCNSLIKAVKIFDFKKDFKFFNDILFSIWKMQIAPIKIDDALSTINFIIINNKKVYLAYSGDGGVIFLGKKDFFVSEKGEFSNITTPFGYSSLKFKIFKEDEIEAIMMCTDGVFDDLQKDKIILFAKDYISYYKNFPKRRRYKNAKKMLSSWPVKGHSDDKTILILYKE